ncbi:MAG TPA: hypothetical protein VM120_09145 [Bryobacteraceae bacterium]|nr:hypothetical protein [Bryobacteraceae bacterium]
MLNVSACAPAGEWYAPPIQRVFNPEAERRVVGTSISMQSPDVERYILKGLLPANKGDRWRWANQRAEIRLQPESTKNRKFFMEFVIADATFKETGPIRMSFFADGQPIGNVRYDQPGEKRFVTEVAEGLLKPYEPMVIAAEADKVFVSPQDGMKLGFLLVRAGFTE